MSIYVIGFGRGGTRLVRDLVEANYDVGDITVIDGDVFEDKNLEVQIFDPKFLGMNKANAAKAMYGVQAIPEWFHADLIEGLGQDPSDFLAVEVDNKAAMKAALIACDQSGCECTIAAAEGRDTEAYYYHPSMRGTPNDPRVFYPSINTDRSGDPLGPPGCVEMAQSSESVDVTFCDVSMELALWDFHMRVRTHEELPPESREFWPIHHRKNKWGLRTIKWGDRLKKEVEHIQVGDTTYRLSEHAFQSGMEATA